MALPFKSKYISRYSSLKYWLPVLLTSLMGCETVVELELPEAEPRLVINSVINPDSLFSVNVSANQSIFSNQKYAPVEKATVAVF